MNLELERKSIWQQIDEAELKEITEYGERYKNFLDHCKTERECVTFIQNKAIEHGYVSLEEAIKSPVKAGDKIYINYKNKAIALFLIGKECMTKGMNIVGSHIDVPRLDIKPTPLYEDSELALMKTHYYGGVKKYQWPTIQLAMHGFVKTKDGKEINIVIGEDDNDPVFYITDLLPHLGKDQAKGTLGDGIPAETLNVVVGHSSYGISEKENPIKKNILKLIHDKYGIVEEDFISSEIEMVPQAKARDIGFDRAMIAAHGHDDRVCSYANLEAILKLDEVETTAVSLFVDKEEIGSYGNASMSSAFFENAVAEILASRGDYSDILTRRAMQNSKILSADVSAAVDPDYKDVNDPYNAALVGYGIGVTKYTGARGKGGCNDANPEFIAEVRKKFDDNGVIWQTCELGKADQGGGGTIAAELAKHGCEVLDCGTAMLSMHAPIELVSKADCYMTAKAYHAFFK